MTEENNPIGRPSLYSVEMADTICARIAEGESVRTICCDEDMPDTRTFYRWIRKHEEFRQQYARAKEDQAEALAEDILDIADDATNDWMERFGRDGESLGWVVNGESVQRSRLRLDARKWLAGKLKPKKYGDATLMKMADSEGNNLQISIIKFSDVQNPPAE